MAYHHIDSADINYPELVKHILQRYGLFIHDAPPINHKPGNDWISDVYYPFPNYPDNRFHFLPNLLPGWQRNLSPRYNRLYSKMAW